MKLIEAIDYRNATLYNRDGGYVELTKLEWANIKKTLIDLAAYNDKAASKHLEVTGSYSNFDEPHAVAAMRILLEN